MVGAFATDFKFHAFETLRTASFVSRTGLVDVDAKINTATVEPDADELARCDDLRRLVGRQRLFRGRIADKVNRKHRIWANSSGVPERHLTSLSVKCPCEIGVSVLVTIIPKKQNLPMTYPVPGSPK